MSKIGKIIRKFDPLAGILHGKADKKRAPVVINTVAKQGSEEEVAQRRRDTANRLKSQRRIKPFDEDDEFRRTGAKLFGE